MALLYVYVSVPTLFTRLIPFILHCAGPHFILHYSINNVPLAFGEQELILLSDAPKLFYQQLFCIKKLKLKSWLSWANQISTLKEVNTKFRQTHILSTFDNVIELYNPKLDLVQ